MDTNKLNQLYNYFTPYGSCYLLIFWCSYSLNNGHTGAITKCRSLYYSIHPNNHQLCTLIVDMTSVTKLRSFGNIFKRSFGGCMCTFVPTLHCTEPSYQNRDTLIEQSTLIQQSTKNCNEPMLKSLSDSISEGLIFKTFFFWGGRIPPDPTTFAH